MNKFYLVCLTSFPCERVGSGHNMICGIVCVVCISENPKYSLVPSPRAPPGEKRSGEQSQISWAYYPKVVMTNEIVRSVIIT